MTEQYKGVIAIHGPFVDGREFVEVLIPGDKNDEWLDEYAEEES